MSKKWMKKHPAPVATTPEMTGAPEHYQEPLPDGPTPAVVNPAQQIPVGHPDLIKGDPFPERANQVPAPSLQEWESWDTEQKRAFLTANPSSFITGVPLQQTDVPPSIAPTPRQVPRYYRNPGE